MSAPPPPGPRSHAATRRPSWRDRWWSRAGAWSAYAAGRCVGHLTRPLPVHVTAALIGNVAATIAPWVPAVRRRVGANLDRVHPDWPADRRRRLMRDSTGQFVRLCLEYLH
ncbi:MAG: hypothetical protein AAFV86_09770, partial [Pseudomonadota bacterium]